MFSTNVFDFKRLDLVRYLNKTMLTCYESMSGDINRVPKKISRDRMGKQGHYKKDVKEREAQALRIKT